MDRTELQRDIQALYKREHEELGDLGTLRQLEEARQWNLAPTLAAGGVMVFPHAGVQDCGHQIAAAVNACLDSGAGEGVGDQRAPRFYGGDGGCPHSRGRGRTAV